MMLSWNVLDWTLLCGHREGKEGGPGDQVTDK